MTSIALFGAGGKMGARLSKNLQGSPFEVRHVEVSEVGQKRLKDELGITCHSIDDALQGVDVVILAVPDTPNSPAPMWPTCVVARSGSSTNGRTAADFFHQATQEIPT